MICSGQNNVLGANKKTDGFVVGHSSGCGAFFKSMNAPAALHSAVMIVCHRRSGRSAVGMSHVQESITPVGCCYCTPVNFMNAVWNITVVPGTYVLSMSIFLSASNRSLHRLNDESVAQRRCATAVAQQVRGPRWRHPGDGNFSP